MTAELQVVPATLAEVASFRVGELGWSTPEVPRDLLAAVVHLVAYESGTPLGCCSVVPLDVDELPAAHLYGVAVRTAHQRRGIGLELVAEARNVARGSGLVLMWARARADSLRFWSHVGLEPAGPWFHEPLNGQLERVVVGPVDLT